MPSPITTHVLDTSLGKPAAGIAVQLSRVTETGIENAVLGNTQTDADGRVQEGLIVAADFLPGTYELRFAVSAYFDAMQTKTFYPEVVIVFDVAQGQDHYHVPLLLSPFGYSTYRGS